MKFIASIFAALVVALGVGGNAYANPEDCAAAQASACRRPVSSSPNRRPIAIAAPKIPQVEVMCQPCA